MGVKLRTPAAHRKLAALYGLMALASGAAREHVNRWRAAATLHELV